MVGADATLMVHGQGREADDGYTPIHLLHLSGQTSGQTPTLSRRAVRQRVLAALLAALRLFWLLAHVIWLSRASSLIPRCLRENSGALMRQRGHAAARARGSTRKCETHSIATHAQVTRPQPISVWRLPAQPGGLRLARLWHARGSHRYPSTPSTPVTLPTLSNHFNFICCIKERCHCNPFAPGSLPDRSLRTPRIALAANKAL